MTVVAHIINFSRIVLLLHDNILTLHTHPYLIRQFDKLFMSSKSVFDKWLEISMLWLTFCGPKKKKIFKNNYSNWSILITVQISVNSNFTVGKIRWLSICQFWCVFMFLIKKMIINTPVTKLLCIVVWIRYPFECSILLRIKILK